MSTIFVFVILAFCQAGYAQDEGIVLNEDQVKAAIQDGSAVYVCVDKTLLEFIGADTSECKSKATMYSRACWHVVDKLVLNYSLGGNEAGKERFDAIANVYTYCLQTHVLMSAIRSKKSGTSETQD